MLREGEELMMSPLVADDKPAKDDNDDGDGDIQNSLELGDRRQETQTTGNIGGFFGWTTRHTHQN